VDGGRPCLEALHQRIDVAVAHIRIARHRADADDDREVVALVALDALGRLVEALHEAPGTGVGRQHIQPFLHGGSVGGGSGQEPRLRGRGHQRDLEIFGKRLNQRLHAVFQLLHVLAAHADAVIEQDLDLDGPVDRFDLCDLRVGAVLHQLQIAGFDGLGGRARAVEDAGIHLDLFVVLRREERAEQTDTGNRGEQLQTHGGASLPSRLAADGN
jgi:hypothetical protein